MVTLLNPIGNLCLLILAGTQPSVEYNRASGPEDSLSRDWLKQTEFIRHSSKVSGQRSASFPGLYGKATRRSGVCSSSFPLTACLSFAPKFSFQPFSVWPCDLFFFFSQANVWTECLHPIKGKPQYITCIQTSAVLLDSFMICSCLYIFLRNVWESVMQIDCVSPSAGHQTLHTSPTFIAPVNMHMYHNLL